MKISPTIMGGLRVDMEEAADWQLLDMIMLDARSCDRGLAERLADAIDDQETAADWSEWVVPELEQGFNAESAFVKKIIETARREAVGEVGPIWINPDDAHCWYGTLNQARLALEALYQFGPSDAVDLESLPIEKRGAFMRSQFYCALQSALLDHVMR